MRNRSIAIVALLVLFVLAPFASAKTKDRTKQRWTPAQVLVKYKAGAGPAIGKHGVKKARKVFGRFKLKGKAAQQAAARGLDRVYLLDLDRDDVPAALAALQKDPNVEIAEPNWRLEFPALPNDPGYTTQWGLAKIGAPAAWDSATSGSGVVVGIVDTGIDLNHPDLAANVWTNPGEIAGNGVDDDDNGFVDDVHGWDFWSDDNDPSDTNGHGTRVAGIVGAVGNNGTGVSGVAWSAKIAPLRMGVQFGDVYAAIQALEYANMMGFRITNNSWGWSQGGQSFLFDDVVATAEANGYLFIAAAGNESKDNDQLLDYPSHYDTTNVIAVTATNQNDGLSYYANWGVKRVDLGAPGDSIDSTAAGGGYASGSGTSFAAPFVAGAAALYWTAHPTATHVEVRDRIFNTTVPVAGLHGKTVTGGRLSLANLFDPETTAPAAINDLTVTDATFRSVWLRFTSTGDDGMTGNALRYDVRVSAAPITAANFANATQLSGEPIPQAPGTLESFKLSGLEASTTYYVAVKAYDNAGNGSALSNVATFTTTRAAVLFDDNAEGGARNWTVAGSDGAGGPSLWHIQSDFWRESMVWSYSNANGYDTGARNYGTLTMPELDLTAARDTRLRFSQEVWLERVFGTELAELQISVDGGPWTTLLGRMFTLYSWFDESIDLSAYDGHRIRLRFAIDTYDAIENDQPGWHLDDVIVDATSADAPPVANLVAPSSVTEDAAASLSSAGSTDPEGATLEYKWSFGDGTYVYTTSTSVAHTWTRPGNYTVTLVAFNGTNSSVPVTTTIAPIPVNDRPVANIDMGFETPPYREEVQLFFPPFGSSDEEGAQLQCHQDFGDGSVRDWPCTGSYQAPHIWMRPGTYTMTLVVNDGELDSLPATKVLTIVEASNDKPVAVPGGPYSGQRNEPVTLDGTASFDEETSIASYLWTFPDGTTSTAAKPVKTFAASGTYNVTLVVTDQTGLASPAVTTQVRICGGATADLFGWPHYTCPGGTARVGVNVSNAVLPITLTWTDGYTQQVTSLFNGYYAERVVTPTGTAAYQLASITDFLGCAGTVGTTTHTVEFASVTLPTYTITSCPGQDVAIAPTFKGDKPWTLTWSDGFVQDIPLSGDDRRHVTMPSTQTTYSIVSATCASCPAGTVPQVVSGTVTLVPATAPVAVVSGGGASCNGGPVPITVTLSGGAGPYMVTWSDGVNQGSNGTFTRYVAPSSTTTYTITSVWTSSCTGTSSGSATVTVGTTPSAVVSGGGSFCPGSSVAINAALTGTAPFTITWSDGVVQTITSGNTATRQVSPATQTAYQITSITGNGCSGSTTGGAVATPRPRPTATVSGTGAYCEGGTTPITATLTGTAPFTVTWSDGVVQTVNSGNTATRQVAPAATTTYTVTAITDAFCSGTSSGSATISQNARPVITTQPQNKTIARNASTTLTVVSSPSTGVVYQWYEGPTGTTTTPVGTNSASFTTPKLRSTTQYWVKVSKTGCTAYGTNSVTATVTVN